MKALAELGADVHARTQDGATAMYLSAQNGHAEVVKALAGLLGADVHA